MVHKEVAIRTTVKTAVEAYAQGFQERHIREYENPNGTLNMKVHNIFISILGEDIQFYTALVRSLDSSLGNLLEQLAVNIAGFSYRVERQVEGTLYPGQIEGIAALLERYKRHDTLPAVEDYRFLRERPTHSAGKTARHESDYYLIDEASGTHCLIELKIGGDLDNKKARSEKEALLEQYAILSNNLGPEETLQLFFGTAYNRFGEGKPWRQGRVLQYFSQDELLIGKAFWDFICKMPNGYEVVLDEYRTHAHLIRHAIEEIKDVYL